MKRTNEGGSDEYQEQRISDYGGRQPGGGACPNDRCYPMRTVVRRLHRPQVVIIVITTIIVVARRIGAFVIEVPTPHFYVLLRPLLLPCD